jgi:MFS family permease
MLPHETERNVKAEPRFYYGYIVVLAAFLIQTAMFGPRASFGVYFKPLISEFGWNRALISGAFSISTIVQGFSGIIMGGLNDRLGPRVVITFCGAFVGLGCLLMSQVHAAWQLYLYYALIMGIGMGSYFVVLLSTVARWFVKRRSLMTGIAMAGGGTGGLIAPPLVTWLISVQGWRNSYLVLGGLVLVVIIVMAQLLRRDPAQMGLAPLGATPEGEARKSPTGAEGFSLKGAALTWQFWMAIFMLFCIGFCMLTNLVHIVPHATDLGISAVSAANVLSITAVAHLTGGILMGVIADKIGIKRAYILCFVLLSGATLWLLPSRELWMFYPFGIALGLGGGGGTALSSPLVAELFGIRSHGLILGVCSLGTTVGSAAGPFIAGHIFDVRGSYHLAFIISAACAVGGLIMAMILRLPQRQGSP